MADERSLPEGGETRRLALRVAYDGRSFPGWQTQPSRLAVQDRLESALSSVAGHPVRTVCAGRTDAGVHALAQVVHFETSAVRPLQAWVRGTNASLPSEIAVQQAVDAPVDFHARFSAQRRAYRYLLLRAPHRQPMLSGRAGWVFQPLDVARLAQAATVLLGEHDFSAFRSSQCQARSPVRRLEQLTVREAGDLLVFELQADAFLHHMVRNIVGALVWIGIGRRPVDWLAEVLAGRDRRRAAPTFAPDGLYLCGVDYGGRLDLGCWPPQPMPVC